MANHEQRAQQRRQRHEGVPPRGNHFNSRVVAAGTMMKYQVKYKVQAKWGLFLSSLILSQEQLQSFGKNADPSLQARDGAMSVKAVVGIRPTLQQFSKEANEQFGSASAEARPSIEDPGRILPQAPERGSK